MAAAISIFDRITQLGSDARTIGLRLPRWQPSVADCVSWLPQAGLTKDAHSLQHDRRRDPEGLLEVDNPVVLGVPSHRAERTRKAYRDLLQKHYKEQGRNPQPSGEALNSLWYELKNP